MDDGIDKEMMMLHALGSKQRAILHDMRTGLIPYLITGILGPSRANRASSNDRHSIKTEGSSH